MGVAVQRNGARKRELNCRLELKLVISFWGEFTFAGWGRRFRVCRRKLLTGSCHFKLTLRRLSSYIRDRVGAEVFGVAVMGSEH